MESRQLNDGRWVACTVAEIVALPSFVDNNTAKDTVVLKHTVSFMLTIQEFFRLAGGKPTTMAEMLWITEKADNQPFKSRIRLYIIVRSLGQSKEVSFSTATSCMNSFCNFLNSKGYDLRVTNDVDQLTQLLPEVRSLYSVIKKERCNANTYSPIPYYYCDIIPENNCDNMEDLSTLLSQQENCCLSFQLFPTQFSQQEVYCIREMGATLNRLVTGYLADRQMIRDDAAREPGKVYTYYNDRLQAPLFQFNILVYGNKETCDVLSAKIISLLQSGQSKIIHSNFGCIDMSANHLNMRSDFLFYPWNINTLLVYRYRNQKIQQAFPIAKSLMRLPYVISAEEAAGFFRLPLYERGMVALRSTVSASPSEQFDEVVGRVDNIQFGKMMARDNQEISIGCPANTFTKHALIVGVPGSGKTTFAFYLLLQFYKKGIPFLAIEPTKSEYRGMIDAIPDLQIFTPGNSDVVPFILNPFIPPKGVRVERYIPSLASAFKAAFSMPSPLDVIFLRAIRECYAKYGWKDYSQFGDEDVTVFGLYDFILVFKRIIAESTYSREVKGNLESGGAFRLLNLIEQNRNIYDNVNTIPIDDLLCKPTIIELNAIENTDQKALIMALLLINICSYTKANQINDGILKNVILIDEAHVMLGSVGTCNSPEVPDARGTTVKALQDMIAEIRSFGTCMIIADQSPAKVSREVIAQTEIKVAFRLVQALDKELIADTTNMNKSAIQQLSKLNTGEAYVYFGKLDSAQLIRTPDIREYEGIRLSVSNAEIKQHTSYWITRQPVLMPYNECKMCRLCRSSCDFRIRTDADYYAKQLSSVCANRIKNNEDFLRYVVSMDKLLSKVVKKYDAMYYQRLLDCVRIKFCREIQLLTPFRIKKGDLYRVLSLQPNVKGG